MKITKKCVLILLVLSLLISCFSACGRKESSKKAPSSTTSLSDEVTMPLDKPVKFTFFTTEHALQPILADAIKWSALTEKTNVTLDVDFAQGTAAKTKLMAAAASGKMYDIIYCNFKDLITYKSDLFIDLTDIMESKLPHYYERVKGNESLDTIKINDKILGLAQINNTLDATDSYYPAVIRYDILEDNNLSIPTSWDEWFTAMKKLKSIYPSSSPVSGRYWMWILKHWEQQLGEVSTFHFDNASQKYTCGVLNDRYKKVLTFMKECYDEGILDPSWTSATDANWNEMVLSDNTFFWIDNGAFAYSQTKQLRESKADAKMWFMPLMSNLFGEKSGYKVGLTSFSTLYCLSSACEHKEELYKFMDWCYTDDGMFVNSLGKEGETYNIGKEGTPVVPKSVWSKYASSAQPNYSYMSDLGLGQLCFAPMYTAGMTLWEDYVDFEDELGWRSADITKDDAAAGNYEEWVQIHPFTDMKLESKADVIETYIYSEIKKFICGQRPITEYDSFVADVKKMGAEGVVKAYNEAMK